MLTFVLGGARSGKSRYCEKLGYDWLVTNPTGKRLYIATCEARDDEMRDRVARHKIQRGDLWQTFEEPMELAGLLTQEMAKERFVLIDCLTLWLTNVLLADQDCEASIDELCAVLSETAGDVVIVSNEVGLGIVPENKLARHFRDIAGIANQKVAEISDKVIFIAAGLPVILKQPG